MNLNDRAAGLILAAVMSVAPKNLWQALEHHLQQIPEQQRNEIKRQYATEALLQEIKQGDPEAMMRNITDAASRRAPETTDWDEVVTEEMADAMRNIREFIRFHGNA